MKGDSIITVEAAFGNQTLEAQRNIYIPLDPDEDTDTDGDGTGNNEDTDDDDDGVLDIDDAFPLDETEWVDTDSDGIGNNEDTDDDGDEVEDVDEPMVVLFYWPLIFIIVGILVIIYVNKKDEEDEGDMSE